MTKARNIAEFADDLSVSNGEVSIADLKPSQSMMFRNKIINGNFDIWQRGTSQTTDGYGSADRWISNQNVSTKTASQQSFANGQTDVPGNPKYYWRHVVTSGNSVDSLIAAEQRIESVQTLAGQTATLSFWAKADSNKNISTELIQSFGFGGSSTLNTIEVRTYNLTTSWQKFTATVSIPSISGKTIGTNGNDCLVLLIWLDAGSVFNSRTNSLGNQSGTFDIAQVQLEEGSVATPFEHRPIGTELALCQRYFQSIAMYGLFVFPYHTTLAFVPLPLFVPLRSKSAVTLSKTAKIIRITTIAVVDYWIDGGNNFTSGGDWAYNMYIENRANRDGTLSNLGLRINKSGSTNFPDQEPVQITGVGPNSSNNGFDDVGGYFEIESEL